MDTNWAKLSPSEKLEARFAAWIEAEGVPFATPEARQAYLDRVQMVKDAVQLRKPVRIPVCPNTGFYPFAYAETNSIPYEKIYNLWIIHMYTQIQAYFKYLSRLLRYV